MSLTSVAPPLVPAAEDIPVPSKLAQSLAKKVIPSLDGLRAIAVLFVIFHHTGVPGAPRGRGVLTFFVLSGFLITWLMLKENEHRGEISIRNFYVRRVLRIFPAFYIYIAVLLAIQLVSRHLPPMPIILDYLASLGYVANYRFAITHRHYTFVGPTWALSIEEQFYLIWPLVFVAFRNDLGKLTRWLIGAIAFVDLYRIVLLRFHVGEEWLTLTFDSRVDHLLVGCLLAVLLKRGVLTRWWTFLTCSLWISLVPVLLSAGSIALAHRYRLPYKIGVGFVVDPLVTAVFLVQVIAMGDTWLWGWLNWRAVRYLGRISYGMFLYHMLAYRFVIEVLHRNPPLWIRVPAVIAVAAIFGALSFHLVEKKFLRLKGRFTDSASPRPSLSVTQPEVGALLEK